MTEPISPPRIQGPFYQNRADWEKLYEQADPWGCEGRWLLERRRPVYMDRVFAAWGPFERGLDLGSGEGSITRVFATHCRSLVSVDIAQQALERQRRTISGDRRLFVHGDAFRLGFRPESFDVICASEVLSYSSSRRGVAEAWMPWLRPGGFLFVVDALLPGYFRFSELKELVASLTDIVQLEALSSKLLLAKLANRKLVPFHEQVYEKAMEWTRRCPETRAKHIVVVGRKRP